MDMKHAKVTPEKVGRHLLLLAVIMLLALSLPSCKSSTSSSTDGTTTTTQASILVTNTYGQTLEIFMDGASQFTLTNGNGATIKDVSIATHTMEAKIADGTVIDTTTIDVTSVSSYTYTIDRPDINITNSFGEPLKIYYDNVYQFTIADDENRWLIGVTLASHFLKATRASNDTEVASTTINVTQNKDYTWTIS